MSSLYPFMKDARYVEIVKRFVDAYSHTIKQHKRQVIADKIKEDAKKAVEEIRNELNKFHSTKKKEIEAEQSKVRHVYKSKRSDYINPQEEQLRRQDFEMEVMSASDAELTSLLNDADRTFSKFEVNRLHVEINKRGMEDESIEMSAVKRALGHGKEYEKDPNYQALDQEDEFMFLIEPRGRETSIYIPTEEGRNNSLRIDELNRIASNPNIKRVSESKLVGNQHANDSELLEAGYNILARNIQSHKKRVAQFNKQQKEDMEEYVDYKEKKGDPIQILEYDDDDLRAVRGSSEHDVEIEYKYLKERYHEKDNYLYSPANPDYEITKHIEFLRGKHQENLNKKPELANAISQKLEEQANAIKDEESAKLGKGKGSKDTETDKQEKGKKADIKDQVLTPNEVVFENAFGD